MAQRHGKQFTVREGQVAFALGDLRIRRFVPHLPLALSLLLGVVAWLTVGRALRDWPEQIILLFAVPVGLLIYFVPAARRRAGNIIGGMSRPTPKRRARIAVAVALLAAAYLAFTAVRQGRHLRPHWHDELSYAVQIQMLARGRLWMPPHPIGEFFESFYLVTSDRAYASMYFPGTAMLYVPAVWFGLPLWVAAVLAAGALVGMTYRLVAELIDGAAGLTAALMLLATETFRTMSVQVMSQIPVALLGLLLVWAFLRWRRRHAPGFAVLMGIFAGWAALTRPLDALAVAFPVGLGILIELFHKRPAPEHRERRDVPARRRLFLAPALVVAGALPFLALQFVVNHHVTGRWTKPAWQWYTERELPGATLGFHRYDPAARPASDLPQKVAFYDTYIPDLLAAHRPDNILNDWFGHRLPTTASALLPHVSLIVLLPAGFLLVFRRSRWVLAALLPSFLFCYAASPWFQSYYTLTAAAAVILLVLLGIEAVAETCVRQKTPSRFRSIAPADAATGPIAEAVQRGRIAGDYPARRDVMRGAAFAAVGVLCLARLPEFDPRARDALFQPTLLRDIDRWTDAYAGPRAVVLFRYRPGRSLHQEPVYNADVAWPDDARVVRAHDLGPRNQKLFDYYAEYQPDRVVYRYDAPGVFTYLGRVTDLVGSAPVATPPDRQ